MAPRSGWPKPLAGWQTLCCVQIQGMTAGWIAAIRADSSCLDGKPRNSNSNKSKHWQKRKHSIMSRNLLQDRWQKLPEAAVRRLQAEQLRQFLRKAVLPFSSHYRETFRDRGLDADCIRTLEDLQKLPFTTKADLLNTAERQ